MRQGYLDDSPIVKKILTPGSPTARAPLAQGAVVEETLEIAGLPRLARTAGKQAVAGEQLRDAACGVSSAQRPREPLSLIHDAENRNVRELLGGHAVRVVTQYGESGCFA